jgi:hypothetical protein
VPLVLKRKYRISQKKINQCQILRTDYISNTQNVESSKTFFHIIKAVRQVGSEIY